ncbi:MAG: phosphoribosylglycinamide formyltransferase [Burkholderiales bacterium]|nr:phosphoribosylglycinamide formyltransferase [Burkholderiales bacterium]
MSEKRIVILISGRGSNMEAIFRAKLPLRIAAVISNNPDAPGLQTARTRKLATAVVDQRQFSDREEFDAALMAAIDSYHPDLVVLAGFMRILGTACVTHYKGRMLNIHPSLLPAFPGLHTHRRALATGARIHGCTVHFVTPELDYGPIVIQAAVPVLADDTEDTLAERVLSEEHRIYPQALRWFAEDRLVLTADDRVDVGQARTASGTLLAPPLDA